MTMNGMLGLEAGFSVSASVDVESENQSFVYFSDSPWRSPIEDRACERERQAPQAPDDRRGERHHEQQRELDLAQAEGRAEQHTRERRADPDHPGDHADRGWVDAGDAHDARRVRPRHAWRARTA